MQSGHERTVGKTLYSQCGHGQVMAYDYGTKVVIKADHHGRVHTLTVYKLVDARDFADDLKERAESSTN